MAEELVKRVGFLKPEPGEVIVLYIDPDNCYPELLHHSAQRLNEVFPQNPVVAMPKNLEITTMDKDKLIEFLQGTS